MTDTVRKVVKNRGPAAAAANRAALLRAGREVFAEGGIDAPLSEVARRAGVGQGSLYRHFPDRVALAVAVFEENVAQLEALAALPGTSAHDLLALLTRQIVESTAFIELVRSDDDIRVRGLADRTAAALGARTAPDLLRGLVRPGDLRLAIEMVAGAVAGARAGERETAAERAWALLGVELRPAAPDA